MVCPNCGTHIKMFDLKPNCKSCGVNIMYFTQERDLVRDAKKAELEFANARIFVAKVKAAFIGGGLQIARLVLTLLCIAAFAVPFASVTFSLPLFSADISVGAVGAYGLYGSGLYSVILSFAKSELFGAVTTKVLIMLAVFVAAVLLSLAVLVIELLSFINIKKSAKALCVVSAIDIAVCVALAVLGFAVEASAADYSYIGAKDGAGAYVAIAVFAANLIINLLIFKKDIKLKLRPNDLERSELQKKVKRGEVNVDDLPLPVFETEEEKEKRLNDLKEALAQEKGGGINE